MGQILKKKDILLVPFPFSDQSGLKRRPALIISNDKSNKDSNELIVCAITSNTDGNHKVYIKRDDWKDGLYSESSVKASSILTIDKKIVMKRIGRLSSERFRDVLGKIREII